MPRYVFTYFNVRGKGEVARMLFAYSGLKYEDVRPTDDEWRALKPNTPLGKLPTLSIDGVVICQELAINNYLARQCGLAGDGDIQMALVDSVAGCVQDVIRHFFPLVLPQAQFDKDDIMFVPRKTPEHEPEKRNEFFTSGFPKFLAKFETMLKKNNGGDGYFVGKSVTLADFSFIQLFDWTHTAGMPPFDLSPFPKLLALRTRVEAIPVIAKYLANRPPPPY